MIPGAPPLLEQTPRINMPSLPGWNQSLCLNAATHHAIDGAEVVRLGGEDGRFDGVIEKMLGNDPQSGCAHDWRVAFDASEAGTWIWEVGQELLQWNERERLLYGFPSGQRMTFDLMMARIHPDDRTLFMERVERLVARGSHENNWNYDFRIIHPELGERWITGIGRVVRDGNGRALRIAGINFDVTERKQAEEALRRCSQILEQRVAQRSGQLEEVTAKLLERQAQLEQANRLALMSEIGTGVIHQIGQPLCAMESNLAVAQVRLDSCQSKHCGLPEILADVKEDVECMREVVRHLRALAHPGKPAFGPVDVNSLLEKALVVLRREAELRGVRLSLQAGADLPLVLADAVQLNQVILNVVRNAIDACDGQPPERCTVTIASRCTPDGQVELTVGDHGCGITPEALRKLFNPLFTTKENGLGIGLRLSRTIVEAHGGSITGSNNEDGMGATFRVLLPPHRPAGDVRMVSA